MGSGAAASARDERACCPSQRRPARPVPFPQIMHRASSKSALEMVNPARRFAAGVYPTEVQAGDVALAKELAELPEG
jgi:hypothetical protein